MTNPTKEMYSLRRSFSIIGLTGRMGAGCTKIAEILSYSKDKFFSDDLRVPDKLKYNNEIEDIELNIFRRKYKICYNFIQKNHIKYEVIDYNKVLLLYMLNSLKDEDDPEGQVLKTITDLFIKSKKDNDEDFANLTIEEEGLKEIEFENLKSSIKQLNELKKDLTTAKEKNDLDILIKLFFDKKSAFNIWSNKLIEKLEKKSYYLKSLMFHRLANNIRSNNKLICTIEELNSPKTENVYLIAKTINRLIKAFKSDEDNKENCHIVINSLKNSLETMFFKERYSAFYLMAVNNNDRYFDRIEKRVTESKNSDIDNNTERLVNLDLIENKSGDFSSGKFFSPDIENCIQKAEIHINNEDSISSDEYSTTTMFFTRKEQLLKFLALLQQPGIITPSSMERCMLTAYNSKFNSGCISRQVGAVVTDPNYSVKAVGWNDVPKKTVTCLLRSKSDLIGGEIEDHDKTYSDFELSSSEFKYSLNKKNNLNEEYVGKNFKENLEAESGNMKGVENEGKNCSFCFKSMHNKFEGKENQVHTRSLHAEENAMLQISKYGGQGLTEGKLFTTASPCELCAKKACQLGIKEIYYIDPYPGISMTHVLKQGDAQPDLIPFKGVIGRSFNKLYEPFMAYKDELNLYNEEKL
jgi:deoxycytidylate deaminase